MYLSDHLRSILPRVAVGALSLTAPSPLLKTRATLPPTYSVVPLGDTTSTIPNIYRDGGGGGKINGLNFIWFADGITTTGGVPDTTSLDNWVNFSSNSIAYSEYNGGGPTVLEDFGTTSPRQQIPYFYGHGEDDSTTAIWPNNNFATLCNGGCGVGFPPVTDRASESLMYNTVVQIEIGAFGPVATRPVQTLFTAREPQFGSFSCFLGVDGYLYTFASITNTAASNGLKMARVPNTEPSTLSAYEYWSGSEWTTTMPAYDDGGVSNIFSFSSDFSGVEYGPGEGDIFYNPFYEVYMIIFGLTDAAIDNGVYLTYSSSLTSGWSTPELIYTTPTLSGGYNYNVHAYPMYDPTGRVIPISWTQYAGGSTYYNAFANVTFS